MRRKEPPNIQTWNSWQSLIVCLYIVITWSEFEMGFPLCHFYHASPFPARCPDLSAKREGLGFFNFFFSHMPQLQKTWLLFLSARSLLLTQTSQDFQPQTQIFVCDHLAQNVPSFSLLCCVSLCFSACCLSIRLYFHTCFPSVNFPSVNFLLCLVFNKTDIHEFKKQISVSV